MKAPFLPLLPLEPLLQIYQQAGLCTGAILAELPVLGPRIQAVLAARQHFLNWDFLDQAGAVEFGVALAEFYERCVFPPLHAETVRRRAGFLRHALAHLLHESEPLTHKAARFLSPDGPYYVAGLGPMFWSALFQAMDVPHQPGYLRGVVIGLQRLGLFSNEPPQDVALTFVRLQLVYQNLLGNHPKLSALHLDHFLCLVAGMRGRELWSGVDHLKATLTGADVDGLIRAERSRRPLRRRVKERGPELSRARADLEQHLATGDTTASIAVLHAVARGASVGNGGHSPLTTHHPPSSEAPNSWVQRLWRSEQPAEALAESLLAEPEPGSLDLAAAALHLREPKSFYPWHEELRQGWTLVEDGRAEGVPVSQRYSLYNEALRALCRVYGLHYLEVPAVLTALVQGRREEASARENLAGFCADTFQFLAELEKHNRRDWMEACRTRYQFVLRQPLIELAEALVERYVQPILNGRWELNLEITVRTGKVLSSICKNDYGRSVPYQSALWLTFCRRMQGKKKDVQFFVRVDATGVSFGLRLGREGREAGKQFRRNVQEQAELVFRALSGSGALARCRFANGDDWSGAVTVGNASELRAWATNKTLLAGCHLPPDSALVHGELVGEILLTFEALLPAYLCAALADPRSALEQQAGAATGCFTAADFARHTHLGSDWLERAQALLGLKRQIILQGVPGTGKTFVAQQLARWLTADRPGAVRLVQFHPAYSYEEFVEGIKVRSVESNGRHDVTYPVEDGVLCTFAASAAEHPAQPFVLVIDEINRGNLPRIFGELLYLLEYRGQSLVLPYSRRDFRLPANLYLIGTMNAADRSVTLIDQALRRRFSFLGMAPDARLLASWLAVHPPRAGQPFAAVVVELFEQLNRQLQQDLGPHCQVGHSYFMAPELDEGKLQVIWTHQVRPLLDEYFAGQPGRTDAYQIDGLLQAHWRERSARTRSGMDSAK
jgi:hypothetical protein